MPPPARRHAALAALLALAGAALLLLLVDRPAWRERSSLVQAAERPQDRPAWEPLAAEPGRRALGDVPAPARSLSAGRSFLIEYWGEEWERYYERVWFEGFDELLDRIDPATLPPWDEAKAQVAEELVALHLAEPAPGIHAGRDVAWPASQAVELEGAPPSVAGRPVPEAALPEARALVGDHDERLRALGGQWRALLAGAIRAAVLSGEGLQREPFVLATEPGDEPLWQGGSRPDSIGAGWQVHVRLHREQHPELAAKAAEIERAREERHRALIELLERHGRR